MNFKRRAMLLISVVSLAALIVTGTFAWTNLTTQRVIEWHGNGKAPATTKAGGTLHNDYVENEASKQVYVENWGEEDLFVRIKLTEYMEVGTGSGLKATVDQQTGLKVPDPQNASNPVAVGSKIYDIKTWASITDRYVKPTGTEDRNLLSNYWTWNMGGQKYYYPAPESSWANYGYVDTSSPNNLTAASVNSAGIPAKQTRNATIMTMAEWIAADKPIGDYWVIDTSADGNGWAYWAAPLKPGDATGLLLDKVVMADSAHDYAEYFDLSKSYYYGINVDAQMATKDGEDIGNGVKDNYMRFKVEGGWSAQGEALMERIVNGVKEPGVPDEPGVPNESEDKLDKAAVQSAIDSLNNFLTRNFSTYTDESVEAAKKWVTAKIDELENILTLKDATQAELDALLSQIDITQAELDAFLSQINKNDNIKYAESLLILKSSESSESSGVFGPLKPLKPLRLFTNFCKKGTVLALSIIIKRMKTNTISRKAPIQPKLSVSQLEI